MASRCLNLRAAFSCSSAAKACWDVIARTVYASTMTPMSSRICWMRASLASRAALMACPRGFACPSPPRPTTLPRPDAASPTPAGSCGAKHESSVGAFRPLDRRVWPELRLSAGRLSTRHAGAGRADHGSWFETPLSSIKKWTDINGVGNFDLAPGEIATHSEEINGRVKFMGTFLSTIPFARKYGVLESPLELWIENSTIRKIATDVPGLEHDFNKYLDANPSNRRIEELGIGTNEGVKERSEERRVG